MKYGDDETHKEAAIKIFVVSCGNPYNFFVRNTIHG